MHINHLIEYKRTSFINTLCGTRKDVSGFEYNIRQVDSAKNKFEVSTAITLENESTDACVLFMGINELIKANWIKHSSRKRNLSSRDVDEFVDQLCDFSEETWEHFQRGILTSRQTLIGFTDLLAKEAAIHNYTFKLLNNPSTEELPSTKECVAIIKDRLNAVVSGKADIHSMDLSTSTAKVEIFEKSH